MNFDPLLAAPIGADCHQVWGREANLKLCVGTKDVLEAAEAAGREGKGRDSRSETERKVTRKTCDLVVKEETG